MNFYYGLGVTPVYMQVSLASQALPPTATAISPTSTSTPTSLQERLAPMNNDELKSKMVKLRKKHNSLMESLNLSYETKNKRRATIRNTVKKLCTPNSTVKEIRHEVIKIYKQDIKILNETLMMTEREQLLKSLKLTEDEKEAYSIDKDATYNEKKNILKEQIERLKFVKRVITTIVLDD